MSDPGTPVEPAPFEDINETVRAEWEAETTPYERVRAVISHTYTPVSAGTVADRAGTSSKTARKHLDTLADEGFVTTEPSSTGATLYSRSPESLVVEQAADILSELSTEELAERVSEMRRQIAAFQRQYGVDSPEELTIDRTNSLLDGSEHTDEDIDSETLREWKTTRRNLAFANAALSIANARQFVGTESRTDTGTSSP
jgi:hypothetical protein